MVSSLPLKVAISMHYTGSQFIIPQVLAALRINGFQYFRALADRNDVIVELHPAKKYIYKYCRYSFSFDRNLSRL